MPLFMIIVCAVDLVEERFGFSGNYKFLWILFVRFALRSGTFSDGLEMRQGSAAPCGVANRALPAVTASPSPGTGCIFS